MSRNVRYVLVGADGFVTRRFSVPAGLVPGEPPEGQRIVIIGDGILPRGRAKLDLRKIRKPVNVVASIGAVRSSWRAPEPSPEDRLEERRHGAIGRLDRDCAARAASIAGPLAALHAEKRRQAEAGAYDRATMPLVADEADRLAILRRAQDEADAIAAIERRRRTIKAALKAAKTEDEIKAAMAVASDDPKEGFFS